MTAKPAYTAEMLDVIARWTPHELILKQLAGLLTPFVRNMQFQIFCVNACVQGSSARPYIYPDLTVVRGELEFTGGGVDAISNPLLIAEVASRGCEADDLGTVAKHYREIPSLEDILIISQDEFQIEHYWRVGTDCWNLRDVKGLDASIDLASIGFTLRLNELYERVIEAEAEQAVPAPPPGS